jgi:hypothetical protein
MRCCINYCWICRYPPPFFRRAKSWSEDATNPTSNSSRHQIKDFARGLLAVLVEEAIADTVSSDNAILV